MPTLMDDYAEFVTNMPDDAEFMPMPTFAAASTPAPIAPRRLLRAALGDAAVISVTEAAEWLPLGDRRAKAWLREQGLIRHLDGKDVVRWRDVLRALDGGPSPRGGNGQGRRSIGGVDLEEVDRWLAS